MATTIERLRELTAALEPSDWEAHFDGTLGRAMVRSTRRPGLSIQVIRYGYGNVPPESAWIVEAKRSMPALLAAAYSLRKVLACIQDTRGPYADDAVFEARKVLAELDKETP